MIQKIKDSLRIGYTGKGVYKERNELERTDYGVKMEEKWMKVWKNPETGREIEEQIFRTTEWEWFDDTE